MSKQPVTDSRPQSRLERRVVAAGEALLARGTSVSPIDVLAAIGWLPQSTVDGWQRGRVECLERVAPVHPDRLAAALEHLRGWAADKGLTASEVAYAAGTRDRRPLRFTADGDQATERAWRTHWMRPDLSEAARMRLTRRQRRAPDLLVIEPLNDWTCTGCGGSGWLLFMERPGPLCMDCADLGHLVFLPAGNAALSRRAKHASRLSVVVVVVVVVVRFSRSRKRYERQGILVEEAALERAEAQCLADEDARARRRERDQQERTQASDQPAVPSPHRSRCSRKCADNGPGTAARHRRAGSSRFIPSHGRPIMRAVDAAGQGHRGERGSRSTGPV